MIFDPHGVRLCTRYSWAPNRLHYCGPEKQADMLGYIAHTVEDAGLTEILHEFDTMYGYLVLIAQANNISDPFDKRVVEAYWVGNRLLAAVKAKLFTQYLSDGLSLKKKLSTKQLHILLERGSYGVPSHNFHVLNVFIRTGHHSIPHTLATMDNCRISWGKIQQFGGFPGMAVSVDKKTDKIHIGKKYLVQMQPLQYIGDKLALGSPILKEVENISGDVRVGDWVALHWGVICDVVSVQQRKSLMYYTDLALRHANASV